MQLHSEPMATTAAITPAPYTLLYPKSNQCIKFGTGPRSYSPELGSSAAGPYISRWGGAHAAWPTHGTHLAMSGHSARSLTTSYDSAQPTNQRFPA